LGRKNVIIVSSRKKENFEELVTSCLMAYDNCASVPEINIALKIQRNGAGGDALREGSKVELNPRSDQSRGIVLVCKADQFRVFERSVRIKIRMITLNFIG
jgi:hypothetical protein